MSEAGVPENKASELSLEMPAVNVEDVGKENTPPSPTSVPVLAPFTSEDTITLSATTERKDDDLSLIVHVDDTLNDLDNDILGSTTSDKRASTPRPESKDIAADNATPAKESSTKPETDSTQTPAGPGNTAADTTPSNKDAAKTTGKSDDKTKRLVPALYV